MINAVNNIEILLVDDEKYILEEVSEALSDEGFYVICADNVDEALRIYCSDSHKISVVITDLKMPGKSGIELMISITNFDEISGRHPVKIIMMSGHAEIDKELNQEGVPDCFLVKKPVDFEQLIDVIKQPLLIGSTK
jgi:two-component system nitrogen regulation response regulator NtrX